MRSSPRRCGETYRLTETDPEGYQSSTPNQVQVTVPGEVNFGDYPVYRVYLPVVLSRYPASTRASVTAARAVPYLPCELRWQHD
mgnify:CR=1 FL=1